MIVGCGCRGRELARALRDRGHVVRGTSRRAEQLPAITAAGAEAVLADPDRVATLFGALEHVSVLVVLLGSAAGAREAVCALHGPRLEMLLHKALDTTVRGVVYEASGAVDGAVLEDGAKRVQRTCDVSRIPYALLDADPSAGDWTAVALAAVESVLS
jgi:nucleoside-diphosphate-sugar epimerase